jgi:hypothetical protein
MVDLLTDAESPSIRAAIDITLSPKNLPDAVVALPQYRDEAVRWVRRQDANVDTYSPDSDEFKQAQVAAIYACAALLVPFVPNLTGETYGSDYRYTRKEVDANALMAYLWKRAGEAIGENNPAPVTETPHRTIFTKACGRRGL